MPDIITLFRERYPQYQDIPDAQVFMKLADPKMFKQVFPEYQDLDDHLIGKNLAAEAGKVKGFEDPGVWNALKRFGGGVIDFGKEVLAPPIEFTSEGPKMRAPLAVRLGKPVVEGMKEGGRKTVEEFQRFKKSPSLGRAALTGAQALETLPIVGAMGASIGQRFGGGDISGGATESALAVAQALMSTPSGAVAPIRGVQAARRGISVKATEKPVIARQKAMNVPPKSPKAVRAETEGTHAAPYLKGAKDLKDVQARVPQALQEVYQPLMDAVDKSTATGRLLNGPDGPVTARDLEGLRAQTSADLQATRKMQPTDQQTAIQKGQKVKELIDRYRQIIDVLDPEIRNYGIDPKRTRATFGAIKGVQKRFEGRSTLLEDKPSGIRKMGQIDLTRPLKDVGNIAAGARDIAAGRGWWTQKPTDVAVREGFRTAGPKPDLTVQPQPPARGLPPGPLVTPPPQPGPITGTPPAVAPTSRAQRLGLLLPEQSVSSARPQIPQGWTEPAAPGSVVYGEMPPTGPSGAPPVSPATPVAANIRIVRDPKTGKMKRQYLTSAGGQIIREEAITVKDAMKAKPAEISKIGTQKEIYHVTNLDNVDNILKNGLRGKDGVFATGDKSRAIKYADERLEGHAVVVMKNPKSAGFEKDLGEEYYTVGHATSVDAKHIDRIELYKTGSDTPYRTIKSEAMAAKPAEIAKTGRTTATKKSSLEEEYDPFWESDTMKVVKNKRIKEGISLDSPITEKEARLIKYKKTLTYEKMKMYQDADILEDKISMVSVEPKIYTDSMGIKWAETPDGVRVSIPKSIPENEVMQYAKMKLAEQKTGQTAVKAQESPSAAAKVRGTEIQAGRTPTIERRLSSPKQREMFDTHQVAILDLKERLRRPGIPKKDRIIVQNMIKEHERIMEAVKRGDPAEMARDFGPIQFPRAGEKPIKGITDVIKDRLKKPFVKDPQAGVLKISGKKIDPGLRIKKEWIDNDVLYNEKLGGRYLVHITDSDNFNSIRKEGIRAGEGGRLGEGVYFSRGISSNSIEGDLTNGELVAIRIKPSVRKNYKVERDAYDSPDNLVIRKSVPSKDLEFTTDGKTWVPITQIPKEIKGITDIKKGRK